VDTWILVHTFEYLWAMTATGFGGNLVKLRELSGFTQRQLASRIGASAASISRWESGAITPKRDDAEHLDAALSANGKLLRTWETETSGSQIPPWMRAVGALEDKAVRIDTVTVSTVPGLVQSFAFAREVFRAGHPTKSTEDVEKLAQLRVRRYERLMKGNDPFVTAIFPEFALRWSPQPVRVDQVETLLAFAQREKTAVHIIPDGTLLLSLPAPVQVYRLTDGTMVASSDHGSGNLVYDTPAQAARIDALVRDALRCALPESHSVKLLEGML
jgi:transcriptional regulator with XRE-family HTH domain